MDKLKNNNLRENMDKTHHKSRYKINDHIRKISALLLIFLVLSFNIQDSFSRAPTGKPSDNSPSDEPPSPVSLENSIPTSQCAGLFADYSNPTDNLISSVVSLCLPGVLKNLNRLEIEECKKILCEYEAAKKGLPPLNCAKKNAYNTCLITGEGYDVIEGLLIGSLRQNIKRVLENPTALLIGIAKKRIEQAIVCNPACSNPLSKTGAITLAAIELYNAYNSLNLLNEQLENAEGFNDNACQELEDIKDELEDILATHNSN